VGESQGVHPEKERRLREGGREGEPETIGRERHESDGL